MLFEALAVIPYSSYIKQEIARSRRVGRNSIPRSFATMGSRYGQWRLPSNHSKLVPELCSLQLTDCTSVHELKLSLREMALFWAISIKSNHTPGRLNAGTRSEGARLSTRLSFAEYVGYLAMRPTSHAYHSLGIAKVVLMVLSANVLPRYQSQLLGICLGVSQCHQ